VLQQVDKMGQTLLRELADVSKRLEHEKTQRSFMQRWAPTALLGQLVHAAAVARGHFNLKAGPGLYTRHLSQLLGIQSIIACATRIHAPRVNDSQCSRSVRECREELAALQAAMQRQAADVGSLRARLADLEMPWLWRCGSEKHL